MKCDFCSSPHPIWSYPAQSFEASAVTTGVTPLLRSAGAWLACQQCSDLIEMGSMNDLAKRSLSAYSDLTDTNYDELMGMILVVQQAFLNRRSGPVERLSSLHSIPEDSGE